MKIRVYYTELNGGEVETETLKIKFIQWVLLYFCAFKIKPKKRILQMELRPTAKD